MLSQETVSRSKNFIKFLVRVGVVNGEPQQTYSNLLSIALKLKAHCIESCIFCFDHHGMLWFRIYQNDLHIFPTF